MRQRKAAKASKNGMAHANIEVRQRIEDENGLDKGALTQRGRRGRLRGLAINERKLLIENRLAKNHLKT